ISEMLEAGIERRKADIELKESEQKFRSLVEQSLVGVTILQQQKFVYVNAGFENITGYNRNELLDRLSFKHIVHEDSLPVLQLLQEENPVEQGKPLLLEIIRRDADVRHIEIISSSIIYQAKAAVIATIIDITDKVMEEQRISKAITQTQEQERMQIGMDLHDNVNQLLSASSIYLGILRNKLEDRDAALEMIESIKTFILDANNEIRNLSHQLAPALDTNATLLNKMEGLIHSINPDKYKLDITLEIEENGIIPYSNEIQTTLYRIVQEQLNNIQKYAKASTLFLKVTTENSNVVLLLKDNGIGFDISVKKDGIGLGNIHRRALALGGRAEISSSPGNGCEVLVTIPLGR
ncbi:MAG: PAS domain S-box protein, partial [Chitinophagaceae bacterium]